MLRPLVLTNPLCERPSFTNPPWKDVCLVTPRHGVRRVWNEFTLRQHARNNNERYAVALRMSSSSDGDRRLLQQLPNEIVVALGMKVMVTENVETDLDITNGARGTVVGVVCHPEEPTLSDDNENMRLQRLPLFILVKMERTRTSKLTNLEESVIPIQPASRTFRIKIKEKGKDVVRTVRRRQFPITAAFAFTDYRSQGQTLQSVIVDIATPPPSGGLNLFNLYVALSRSPGRSQLRLLRDFDDNLFLKSHCNELLMEDDRLEAENNKTRIWWNEMQSTAAG